MINTACRFIWMIRNVTVAIEIFHKCESDFGIFFVLLVDIYFCIFSWLVDNYFGIFSLLVDKWKGAIVGGGQSRRRPPRCWWWRRCRDRWTRIVLRPIVAVLLPLNPSHIDINLISVSFKHLLPKSGPFATVPVALRIAGTLFLWVRPGKFLFINRTCLI